jgi:tetratricopeptide (TPR) repeat protein
MRFQLPDFDLSLNLNCYFLKAAYEYIIGNYNAAKDEFDNLIEARKDNTLNQDTENKQLSLCYYYRGLIGYNIQEDLVQAEKFMDLAVKADPQINGPDFKSLLLRAEINFKLQKPEAFDLYNDITKHLEGLANLTKTQKRLMSHAYLGMAYCKILEGGKKFLPLYYDKISQQLPNNVISDVIKWLNKSADSHIYTLLTLGQLAIVFEETNRKVKGLEPSDEYFQRTYTAMEESKPYEVKEETRAKILAYSAKLVCEKFLNKSMDHTKLTLKDLLSDQELKAIYSVFSKANVSKIEYMEELKAFV